ncbi:unnamed protein product, partial [Pelagomonas calceolata]
LGLHTAGALPAKRRGSGRRPLEEAEELLLRRLLPAGRDFGRGAHHAAARVHALDLLLRQSAGVAPHLLVVREAVALRARGEVVALGAAAPVQGLPEEADVGLDVVVLLVRRELALLLRFAVVVGRHAEARLHPALLALEVRVVPGPAALHVGHVLQRDVALAHLVGVHGEQMRRLAALHRVDERVEGAALEAARAARAEVLARALLLFFILDLLPLGGGHACASSTGEFCCASRASPRPAVAQAPRRRRGGHDAAGGGV